MAAPRERVRLPGALKVLVYLPILAYLVLAAAGLYWNPARLFEPPRLFPWLNFVFLLGIGLGVAWLAGRAYLGTGAVSALALGTGMRRRVLLAGANLLPLRFLSLVCARALPVCGRIDCAPGPKT